MTGQILVVTAEPAVADTLVEELTVEGHGVSAASDPAGALRAVRTHGFDVVVVDLASLVGGGGPEAPGGGGLDLLRALREQLPTAELVLLTEASSLAMAVAALREGPADLAQKPIHLDQLLSTVARAVERRHLRAENIFHGRALAAMGVRPAEALPEPLARVTMDVLGADGLAVFAQEDDGRAYALLSYGAAPPADVGSHVARAARDRAPRHYSVEPVEGGDTPGGGVAEGREDREGSGLVYPLASGDRLLGVLYLRRQAGVRPFSRSEVELASVGARYFVHALGAMGASRQRSVAERLETLGRVATSVVHEINNPMSYVITGVEHLTDQLDNLLRAGADAAATDTHVAGWWESTARASVSELRQVAGEAREGVWRIRDVLRDIRLFGKGTEGDVVSDLITVLRSALRIGGGELASRGNLVTRLTEHSPVRGAAGLLAQVFTVLIVHAAQALESTPSGKKTVEIATRRDGNHIIVEVTDSGAGLAADQMRRAFETAPPGEPTHALTLAGCREIVRRFGGDLHLASTLGRGTTFTVSLPVAPASAARAAAAEAERRTYTLPPPGAVRARGRLLFVDDEPNILRSYTRLFRDEYDVTVAAGGEAALAILAQRNDFDLVVCDVMMPEINGMEVFRQAIAVAPHLSNRFVFITANLGLPELDRLAMATGNVVMKKPFDTSEVRALLRKRLQVD